MNKVQREFVAFFRSELRRLQRPENMQSGPVREFVPRNRIVYTQPAAPVPMSMPRCLLRPDTEASLNRRAVVLRREFWLGKLAAPVCMPVALRRTFD